MIDLDAAATRVEKFLTSYTRNPTNLDPERIYTHNDHDLLVSDLLALLAASRAHLGSDAAVAPEVRWASNWGATRRHVINEQWSGTGKQKPAICSVYTYVLPVGRHTPFVPLANSPSAMALPACKLCERKVTK